MVDRDRPSTAVTLGLLVLIFLGLFFSGCGIISDRNEDKYLALCLQGDKRGQVALYVVPKGYELPATTLLKCEG